MFFSVGLTGGIGSGKSTVAAHFATLGAALVDTDVIAHELTAAGGAAMDAIGQHFGHAFVRPDGALDRARMRAHVFQNPAARAQLEALLHPLIRTYAETQAAQLARSAPYVMFVVPLLVESADWRARVTRVLLVDCSTTTQIERVQERNGWSEAEAHAALHAQATRAQRLNAADDVLVNEGDTGALPTRILRLHEYYTHSASTHRGGVTIAPR